MAPYVVGLTGGIGSGKSAAAEQFEALGARVVDADQASRAVMAPGGPAFDAIVAHFGPDVRTRAGELDRQALRARVFADAGARRWLETLTHPLIGQWLREQLASGEAPYSILVNPLLVESGQKQTCHRVLVVDAPEALQLERARLRDASSEAQIRAIMATQASREERLAAADDVIVNDRDLAHLAHAVGRLDAKYRELSRG